MKRRLIENGWRSYAEHVLPAGAPPVQTQETRRAFYAGAGLLLEALNSAVGPDEVSEDEGVAIFESCHAEITAFLEDVKRGKR